MEAAANLSFLWPDLDDPYERFEAAAHAGFRAVERLFVHDLDVGTVAQVQHRHGLQLVLFDPYPGDWERGERGLLCDPARGDDFDRSMYDAFTAADRLGVRLLNVLAGNRPAHLSEDEACEVLTERLARVAVTAQSHGLQLLLETINNIDMPRYLLSDVQRTVAVLRQIDHPSVGLLFDAYHVAMSGRDVVDELDHASSLVRHVQVADCPGRHEPGTGTIDYAAFFGALADQPFGGYVGLEFHPSNTTSAALDDVRATFPSLSTPPPTPGAHP